MQKEESEGININNKFNLENLYEIISDNNIFQKDLTLFLCIFLVFILDWLSLL